MLRSTQRERDPSSLPVGVWLIVALALVSSVLVALAPSPSRRGLTFWTFARNHKLLYDPINAQWNARQTEDGRRVDILLLSSAAVQRRVLSAFLSGTPVADLVESLAGITGQTFKGPLASVGFTDLTDRLQDEGIYAQINEPSFGPWTTRGRIFGLPHDVHPVLLAYRADLVEEAGLDVAGIETWDDFVRVLSPLMRDGDGDGFPDRYLLNLWETNHELIEVLILHAGGAFFDPHDQAVIDSEVNARVLATVVTWTTGPRRIATNAPEFDAAGNKMRLDGYVVCSLLPDWLTGVWKQDLPQLAGRVKVIPLPAWEPGGRRTSVQGGTMLGIPKAAPNFDAAWAYAKHLYLSPELARDLFRTTGIISPIKSNWSDPVYDEPSAYFRGQAVGRAFIAQAPHVPRRSSSPYNELARFKVADAAMGLKAYARKHDVYTVEGLLPEAHRLLREAQQRVQVQIDRNVFLAKVPPS